MVRLQRYNYLNDKKDTIFKTFVKYEISNEVNENYNELCCHFISVTIVKYFN